MVQIGVEVLTQMSEEDPSRQIKHSVKWLDLWRERRGDVLSQKLTPEDVAARFGLQVKVVEDEEGLRVTVSPLNEVLEGAVVYDNPHRSLVSVVTKEFHTDGESMAINALPGQFVEVKLGESFESPTNTTLYVFPDTAT